LLFSWLPLRYSHFATQTTQARVDGLRTFSLMDSQTYKIEEYKKSGISYTLFISSQTPDPVQGETGDLWFHCARPNDARAAYNKRNGSLKFNISAYVGKLHVLKGSGWEEQNVTPAEPCSNIRHPVKESWRLNTRCFTWRSSQSFWNHRDTHCKFYTAG
jgi:hypothetical protein